APISAIVDPGRNSSTGASLSISLALLPQSLEQPRNERQPIAARRRTKVQPLLFLPVASGFGNFAEPAIVTVFVIMTTKMSTGSRPRVKAARRLRRVEGGRLMSELINAIVFAYFPLRAIGDGFSARVGQTTAEWGLLRTLRDSGDMTVAAL